MAYYPSRPRSHRRAYEDLVRELHEMRPVYESAYEPSYYASASPRRHQYYDEDRQQYYNKHWDSVQEEAEKKSFVSKDGFKVSLDVQHYAPHEISVKTEHKQVVVHAKHEEKRDQHGHIARQFTRRYDLPDEFKTEDVTSSLSSDGVLTIKVPRNKQSNDENARHVPIQHTGPHRNSGPKDHAAKM